MVQTLNDLDTNKKYTYADYLTWQFDEYVELIKGKIYPMSPAPSRWHQLMLSRLHGYIFQYFIGKECDAYLAPFDVRLLDRKKSAKANKDILTVVQPDLCVICDKSKLDDAGCIGSPDWIVEILSPGTRRKDRKEKLQLYEENGVREYWIVSPEGFSVTVYDLVDERYAIRNVFTEEDTVPVGIFPGLSVEMGLVFAE